MGIQGDGGLLLGHLWPLWVSKTCLLTKPGSEAHLGPFQVIGGLFRAFISRRQGAHLGSLLRLRSQLRAYSGVSEADLGPILEARSPFRAYPGGCGGPFRSYRGGSEAHFGLIQGSKTPIYQAQLEPIKGLEAHLVTIEEVEGHLGPTGGHLGPIQGAQRTIERICTLLEGRKHI